MPVTFANPWFLALGLLVPPLVWWRLRQRRAAVRYPSVRFLAGLPAGRGRVARWGSAALRGLALLLLVVALAGPRWPDLRSRIPAEGIAIEMVVDVSGSMAEADFEWQGQPVSRLDAVKKVFGLFVSGGELDDGERLEGRPGDLIGLVVFATRAKSVCALTLSHSVLVQKMGQEQPREGNDGQTNITDGLVLGLNRLMDAKPDKKVLVLFSDGEHNVAAPPSKMNLAEAAQRARDLGIVVHAIDAGGTGQAGKEAGVKETSAEVRAEGIRILRELADKTRGRYFAARDTESLLKVCREIDALERTEVESYQYRRYHEGYPWFGLASFVCMAAVYFLELTFWRRVP